MKNLNEDEIGVFFQSSSLLFPTPILVLPFQGFSVEGQENLQEILSKQLLLCQFLMALSVVRTGDTPSAVSPPQDPPEAPLERACIRAGSEVKEKKPAYVVTGG